jgi:hypothetical protein
MRIARTPVLQLALPKMVTVVPGGWGDGGEALMVSTVHCGLTACRS